MYNNNLAVKEVYEPIMTQQMEIKVLPCYKQEKITSNDPALLPKEQYCCNMATD